MFNKIKCTIGLHLWRVVKIWNYRDVSYGEPGTNMSNIVYKCENCDKFKQQDVYGKFDLKELQKND